MRSAVLIMLLAMSMSSQAMVVQYAFTGGFTPTWSYKEGIFAGGPDTVTGYFRYSTDNWQGILTNPFYKKTYYETPASTDLDISITYDGTTYHSSPDPAYLNRISIGDDVSGEGFRDGFQYSAIKQVTSSLQEYFIIGLRSQNADPLNSLDIPVVFDLDQWDNSKTGAIQFMDQDQVIGRMLFEVESLTPVPLPAAIWLFGTTLFGFGFAARNQHKKR